MTLFHYTRHSLIIVDDLNGTQILVGLDDEMDFGQMTECGAPLNTYGEPRVNQEKFPFTYYAHTYWHYPNPSIGPNYRTCAPNTFGRYLYIRFETAPSDTKALPICEVRAYGKGMNEMNKFDPNPNSRGVASMARRGDCIKSPQMK